MAYSIDGTDILINGWENGISDNPYKGINEMRGVNIVSVPGEVSVSFKQENKTFQHLAMTIVSADPSTDIITATVTQGALDPDNNRQCIIFSGASLPVGISADTPYWVLANDETTFTIYATATTNTKVNITATGTGTASSIDMAEIRYFDKNYPFCVDTNGRAWVANYGGGSLSGNYWKYLGNATSAINDITNGNGICLFKSSDNIHEYLFVFRNGGMDYMNLTTGVWVAEWNPLKGGGPASDPGVQTLNTAFTVNNNHEALISLNDNTMYITDGRYIASLFENPGQVFDPTSAATFTWAKQAIASPLPNFDISTSIAELGDKLLIGGQKNAIYPWDRISSGPKDAILISENGITSMITVNTNTYIFAGRRGRIYITNGSQAQLYTKIPDHISGGIEPVFTWRGSAYNKNQLYFGVEATTNGGTALTAYQGLWAVDITTNSTRVPSLQSTDATVVSIFADVNATTGYALYVAWKVGSTVGIDSSLSTPYDTYRSSVVTDIIPVGQFLTKRSLTNIEFKLSAPLVSGEGIEIYGRTSLTSDWTLIGTNEIAGTISDAFILNLELMMWLQLKVRMKSTATTPSYCRLYELRLR